MLIACAFAGFHFAVLFFRMNYLANKVYFAAADVCLLLGLSRPGLCYHTRTLNIRGEKIHYAPRRIGRKKRLVLHYDFWSVVKIARHVHNRKANSFLRSVDGMLKIAQNIAYGRQRRPAIYDGGEIMPKDDLLYQILTNHLSELE